MLLKLLSKNRKLYLKNENIKNIIRCKVKNSRKIATNGFPREINSNNIEIKDQ